MFCWMLQFEREFYLSSSREKHCELFYSTPADISHSCVLNGPRRKGGASQVEGISHVSEWVQDYTWKNDRGDCPGLLAGMPPPPVTWPSLRPTESSSPGLCVFSGYSQLPRVSALCSAAILHLIFHLISIFVCLFTSSPRHVQRGSGRVCALVDRPCMVCTIVIHSHHSTYPTLLGSDMQRAGSPTNVARIITWLAWVDLPRETRRGGGGDR